MMDCLYIIIFLIKLISIDISQEKSNNDCHKIGKYQEYLITGCVEDYKLNTTHKKINVVNIKN